MWLPSLTTVSCCPEFEGKPFPQFICTWQQKSVEVYLSTVFILQDFLICFRPCKGQYLANLRIVWLNIYSDCGVEFGQTFVFWKLGRESSGAVRQGKNLKESHLVSCLLHIGSTYKSLHCRWCIKALNVNVYFAVPRPHTSLYLLFAPLHFVNQGKCFKVCRACDLLHFL